MYSTHQTFQRQYMRLGIIAKRACSHPQIDNVSETRASKSVIIGIDIRLYVLCKLTLFAFKSCFDAVRDSIWRRKTEKQDTLRVWIKPGFETRRMRHFFGPLSHEILYILYTTSHDINLLEWLSLALVTTTTTAGRSETRRHSLHNILIEIILINWNI